MLLFVFEYCGFCDLGTSAPIFLLSSGESNGHLILHTTSEQVPVSQRQERADNVQPLLKEASSSLEIVHEAEAGCSSGNRPSLLGSGKSQYVGNHIKVKQTRLFCCLNLCK